MMKIFGVKLKKKLKFRTFFFNSKQILLERFSGPALRGPGGPGIVTKALSRNYTERKVFRLCLNSEMLRFI